VTVFSFLHAADLHLDSPLRGLDPDAPAARIRAATRDALVNLIDLALDRNVAFLVLSGDLYDGDLRDWRTGHFLIEQLGRLKRAGIGVFAISGNHDAEQVLTKQLPFPGTMFPSQKPDTALLPELGVALHGQSFATSAVLDNLALGYPDPVDEHFNIGLLHTACGSVEHDNYAPCSPSDLAGKRYDYWALGHVHGRQELSRDPWIIFPGNLQGRHVNEQGAKGATLVSVAQGMVQGATHEALDVLRWLQLDLDVSGLPDLAAIQAAAAAALADSLARADSRLLVARVTLHGATPAHAALARDPGATREGIRAAVLDVADRSALWVEDVRVRTTPPHDFVARPSGQGAVAALLDAILQPCAPDAGLQAVVADFLKRTGVRLHPDHPAAALLDGRIPDELAERARALVLAELADR